MATVADFHFFPDDISVGGIARVLAVSIGVKLPHNSWTPPYTNTVL